MIDNPVFIGGTGRCGTTIVGQILDEHPVMAITRPAELRFLTDEGGLIEIMRNPERQPPEWARKARKAEIRMREGSSGRRYQEFIGGPADRFAWLLRSRWYLRESPRGKALGLMGEASRDEVEAVAADFPRAYRRNRAAAARMVMHRLVDPMATRRGKACWVETTPQNVRCAQGLHEIYPQLRLVNMIRDGRDVADSMTRRKWAPDAFDEALDMWRDLMLAGHAAMSQIPAGRVLTVQLEDLISRDRAGEYWRLLEFLELEDAPAPRSWFDANVDAGRGRVGRWRRERSGAELERIDARYAQALGSLRGAGVVAPT